MNLEIFWKRIGAVRELTFHASSGASTGWIGTGVGTVDVSQPVSDVWVFSESGTWSPKSGNPVSFTNVYRWTLLSESIRLEHLRFGTENPVDLFELGIVDDERMESVGPHM